MSNAHNIGELNENDLHASLKDYFFEPGDLIEQKLEGFTIDLIRGNQLIEIQSGNFSSMKKKLNNLLDEYKITIVHPVINKKRIVRLSSSNEIVSSRKSPKTGKIADIFNELIYITDYFLHENLNLSIPIIDVDEFWKDDGKGSWRRKGWSKTNKKLTKVHEIRKFNSNADYLELIPNDLPQKFTNRDLSLNMKLPMRLSQKMTFCFRKAGLLEIAEKKGNAFIFQISDK